MKLLLGILISTILFFTSALVSNSYAITQYCDSGALNYECNKERDAILNNGSIVTSCNKAGEICAYSSSSCVTCLTNTGSGRLKGTITVNTGGIRYDGVQVNIYTKTSNAPIYSELLPPNNTNINTYDRVLSNGEYKLVVWPIRQGQYLDYDYVSTTCKKNTTCYIEISSNTVVGDFNFTLSGYNTCHDLHGVKYLSSLTCPTDTHYVDAADTFKTKTPICCVKDTVSDPKGSPTPATSTITPKPSSATATPTPTPLPPTKPGWCADDLRGNAKPVLSSTCSINSAFYNGTYDDYCNATFGSPTDNYYECAGTGTPLSPGYCANASRTSNPVTINSATCGINNTSSDSTYDKWCVDNYGVNDSQSNYFYKCTTPTATPTTTPSPSTTISPTPVTPGFGCATPNPSAIKTGYECPSTTYGGCAGALTTCKSNANSTTGCMCTGSGPTATPVPATPTPTVADTCANHNGVCGDTSYPDTHPNAKSWGPLAPCQSSYCWVGPKNCAEQGGVCGDSSYPNTHPGKVSWGQLHPCTGSDYCWANP